MSRLIELELDNASLQQEIDNLHKQKADLLKEIEKIKKNEPSLSTFNQLKSLLSSTKSKIQKEKEKEKAIEIATTSNGKRRRLSRYEEEYPIPEPVVHEFFDQSISKYFTTRPPPTKRKKTNSEAVSDAEKYENVLLENIYRMFGITAFPVVDPSVKKAASHNDMIGIRIEIFNELELKFETPHYIILSRNSKTGKWAIFKHTVPQFVEIYKWAKHYDNLSDYELIKFLKKIRDILQKTSYKHQVVNTIKDEFKLNVKNVEKDLPLKVLKFKFSFPSINITTPVILNLTLDSIESCHIDQGYSENEKKRISNVLKGDIKGFKRRLHDVIRSM